MQLGKHVYVEKPLTRTPWEARLLTQAAEKYKVATQMGNQGYSHDATRVACEIIWSGEIGEVREVHAWTGRASWPQEMTKIAAAHASSRHARLGSVARRRGGSVRSPPATRNTKILSPRGSASSPPGGDGGSRPGGACGSWRWRRR